MVVYLRSGGRLRERLQPDVDQYTRRVEVEGAPTLREILDTLRIPRALVAFGYSQGTVRRLDYRPADGETITLQPPVAGG
ncbi:MAG: MoaD/ThiS family protein [Candidatus Eisenbacteria bacterium]|nr:MoaD/ThiS family protein [Candidatus Eisenbacteria bacterium]